MRLQPDGNWVDYKTEEYWDVLRATAWTWLNIIEARLTIPENISPNSAMEAYRRSTISLAQLPLEYGTAGSPKRFDRCRWRDARVPMVPNDSLHCEHPWSKKLTKEYLWDTGSAALQRGATKDELVEPFSEILDARQDTVLLPHTRVTQFGVLSERAADGLAKRYTPAVLSGGVTLIDRETGMILSVRDIEEIEDIVQKRVSNALKKIKNAGLEKNTIPTVEYTTQDEQL